MGRAYEVRKAAMAKTNAAKSKVYSRYGKEIYMAAKSGTPDPESNVALKRIVEKAKKDQVPADVVKRAIDKAKGGSGDSYNTAIYEGFGPGSATIIVDCLTDNVNRTVAEVRNCFTKTKNKMGVSGCVMHSYTHTSMVVVEGMEEDEVLETLLMADCDMRDMEEEDGLITIYGEPQDLYKIKTAIEDHKPEANIEMAEVTYLPIEYTTLEGEELERFEKLLSMLDEIDDVQDVYHNVEL